MTRHDDLWAVVAMVVMIVAVDWLFWRPIVAWSQKFRIGLRGRDRICRTSAQIHHLGSAPEVAFVAVGWTRMSGHHWMAMAGSARSKQGRPVGIGGLMAVDSKRQPVFEFGNIAKNLAGSWLVGSLALAVMAGVVWGTVKVVMLLVCNVARSRAIGWMSAQAGLF